MAKGLVITAEMIDWDAYKNDVEQSIVNETLWGMGGSPHAQDNIRALEEELSLIEDEAYDDILAMYDNDVWVKYLKN